MHERVTRRIGTGRFETETATLLLGDFLPFHKLDLELRFFWRVAAVMKLKLSVAMDAAGEHSIRMRTKINRREANKADRGNNLRSKSAQ